MSPEVAEATINLETSKNSLKEGTKEYPLERKRGTMNLNNLVIERQHSFLEYVFGGCEIDLSIAIDFTLSNGRPTDNGSLHNFNA